ncbi:hypothetical protein ACX6XY_02885 [Streptomyces sp. O3]
MTAGWGVRTVRAAVFAAVCVLLSALGHVMMSGVPVAGWALAAGAATVGATAWCLAGRERGSRVVITFAVAAQTVLHSWFSFAQTSVNQVRPGGTSPTERLLSGFSPPSQAAAPPTPADATGHAAHVPFPADSTAHHADAMASVGHDMSGLSSTGMLAAHLLAALLCGLWLAYGERAAFRILRALTGWLFAPLELALRLPTPPHRPRVRARRWHSSRALRQFLLVHAITSRGPPVGTAVA